MTVFSGLEKRIQLGHVPHYRIEAARLMIDHTPDVHSCIVGEGELLSDVDQQARRVGVVERVRFAGFARYLGAAFAAFDVVMFPSLREGTPVTAFEALASERPIVASDADGLTDILHDGRDPIVPRDPGALARAVLVLLGAPRRHTGVRSHVPETDLSFLSTTGHPL